MKPPTCVVWIEEVKKKDKVLCRFYVYPYINILCSYIMYVFYLAGYMFIKIYLLDIPRVGFDLKLSRD